MRILLIEDLESIYGPLISSLEDEFEGIKIAHYKNFKEAEREFDSIYPDIAILDLSDKSSEEFSSKAIWQKIWANNFCPVIFYSGYEITDHAPEIDLHHPFIKYIKKSSVSEGLLIDAIDEFSKEIREINEVHRSIEKIKHSTLRITAPEVWKLASKEERIDILSRVTRRHLAASFDNLHPNEPLKSWEIYIYPPIGNDLQVADILKSNESEYFIVLTPSCDLSTTGGRSCAEEILVANCEDIHSYLKKVNLHTLPAKEAKIQDWRDKLAKQLTQPHGNGYIALPSFGNIIPHLSLNTKSLKLIKYVDISLNRETKKYNRIASIDSPFREYIAWGFMQNACRPGIPDRDLDTWISELEVKLKEETEAKEKAEKKGK